MRTSRTRPRLLLIGIDAADSRLVRQWASEGHLPTLAKLMNSGVVAPIVTPPAVLEGGVWPTFLTGTSPATHGMFAYEQVKPGTYELELGLRADRLRIDPFWLRLSKTGKRVAVIDAPFAKPYRRLNGIQVTNWGAHDAWSWPRSSWPPHLIADLVARFGDHPVESCDARIRRHHDYEDLRERLIAGVQKKAELLRYCFALENWDFFFGVFSESHCVGHQYWHLMDPEHPRHDPDAPPSLKSAIRDVYRAIDTGVATLLEATDSDTHVLVMLSHGMGQYYTGSHLLDQLLECLGVNAHSNDASRGAGADTDGFQIRSRVWATRRLLPAGVRQMMKRWLPLDLLTKLWSWSHPEPTPWPRMRAFPVPSSEMTGAIRINLKGREPAGRVEPGSEYDTLCRELTDALLALENPDTGRKAVQWVTRASDLYKGPRLRELPDLFIEWDHSAPITALRSPHIGTLRGEKRGARTGSHWPGGLLVGLGPGFRSGEITEEVRTLDIAPTILGFFGVPSPKGFEGSTVLAFLREDGPGNTLGALASQERHD